MQNFKHLPGAAGSSEKLDECANSSDRWLVSRCFMHFDIDDIDAI